MKIIIYLDVNNPTVAENIATDIQADLVVANDVKKSWVNVFETPEADSRLRTIPWIESR